MYQIALIEDSPSEIAILRYALENGDFEYRLMDFSTGDCALRFLASVTVPPDLIVTDSNMPRMGLEELLKRLKNLDVLKGVPIIVLSGITDPRLIERARALGAVDYLVKPSDLRAWPGIIQRMKKWIEVSSKQDAGS